MNGGSGYHYNKSERGEWIPLQQMFVNISERGEWIPLQQKKGGVDTTATKVKGGVDTTATNVCKQKWKGGVNTTAAKPSQQSHCNNAIASSNNANNLDCLW